MLSFSNFPALLEAEDHASTFVQTRCTWHHWGILHMSTWAGSKFDPPPFSPSKLALFTKVGPKNPRNLREFPKCPTNHDTFSPAKSEFHLWQNMATNSQHFPALRHLLVRELLFLFLGLEDAQDGNFGGNLPPIWAMKMSSTPNSPISCESRTGPGVAYVQTNPLLPEKKHKEHQIWETFWSQKNRKDGWI